MNSRDTQPRTLSGIPRLVGPESPAEDVRNALSILINLDQTIGGNLIFPKSDRDAVEARLWLAVNKLEGRTP